MIIRSVIIALRNLVHDPSRTGIALAGSGFSLIVIFMQLGFFRATQRTATLVLEKLDFDLVITSKDYQYFSEAGTFPIERVRTAGSVPGVASVVPFYVRTGLWRSLGTGSGVPSTDNEPARWRRRSILVLSYFTTDRPFLPGIPGLEEQGTGLRIEELEKPFALFVDRRSRWEFGPREPGTPVELNNQRFRLAGTFEMGTGFAAEGAALLSNQNFSRAFGDDATDQPSLALIKLTPLAKVEEVEIRLREALPGSWIEAKTRAFDSPGRPDSDVRIFRRSEIEWQERLFWVREKTIGVLFLMGVAISFLVGLVVFYQVLSSDIADHISEYATLKAIGYSDASVAAIVMGQASILGLLGYLGALAAATGLYALVQWKTGIPMTVLDGWVLGIPMVLSQVMSSGSALISIRKLASADPADLFR
jgi:putative ABC transport system permease protein